MPQAVTTMERVSVRETASDRRRSLLIVLPVAPWPARHNGISIRYYPLINSLAKRHRIDLFVHSEARSSVPNDPLIPRLNRISIQHKIEHPPGIFDRISTLAEALSPFGQPYRFAQYHTDIVRRQLCDFVATRRYDSVLWVVHEYRRLLSSLKTKVTTERTVYDGIDSPYLHHLREHSPHRILSLWRTYDLWKTRRWEQSLLAGVDAAAYISEPDAETSMINGQVPVEVIPNGIYLAGEPRQPPPTPAQPSIGFLGNMGYAPNVQGALQLHEKVFVPLKREIPELRLVIIGREPVAAIRKLASPGVEVTGTVESIWPNVARVGVFVYPMTAGAGLQNKILEAMHAGKPVVTTEICVKSLGAREGEEILVARTDNELRAHTRALIRDPAYARELGLRGKAYVDQMFDLSHVIERFEQFLLPDVTP